MEILTYSVVVGSTACNAKCPWCVSKTTPPHELKPNTINWTLLNKGAQLAIRGGATTLLITGKGEPTLYPHEVLLVIQELGKLFPIIELQTNGYALHTIVEWLPRWKSAGLTTVAISIAYMDNDKSAELMGGRGTKIQCLVNEIHKAGLMARLSLVMVKGGVDSAAKLISAIGWAKDIGADQLSVREVANSPEWELDISNKRLPGKWTREVDELFEDVFKGARILQHLPYGAVVLDVQGQNVCLTNCLTPPTDGVLRQIIYTSEGVFSDWTTKASRLI